MSPRNETAEAVAIVNADGRDTICTRRMTADETPRSYWFLALDSHPNNLQHSYVVGLVNIDDESITATVYYPANSDGRRRALADMSARTVDPRGALVSLAATEQKNSPQTIADLNRPDTAEQLGEADYLEGLREQRARLDAEHEQRCLRGMTMLLGREPLDLADVDEQSRDAWAARDANLSPERTRTNRKGRQIRTIESY